MELLAVTVSAARKFGEIGFLIGALGAVLLVVENAMAGSQSGQKLARTIGFVLMAVGFILGILYVHWI
jgi:hypothetical protein